MNYYKQQLLTLIEQMEDSDFLEYVFRFVVRLKKNWGL